MSLFLSKRRFAIFVLIGITALAVVFLGRQWYTQKFLEYLDRPQPWAEIDREGDIYIRERGEEREICIPEMPFCCSPYYLVVSLTDDGTLIDAQEISSTTGKKIEMSERKYVNDYYVRLSGGSVKEYLEVQEALRSVDHSKVKDIGPLCPEVYFPDS